MVSFWTLGPSAFLLLAIAGVSEAFSRLSVEENVALQESCGVNMREYNSYSRKVLNGTKTRAGEAPWIVATYITDHKGNTVYTTGTLISERHVLTYDSIFLLESEDGIYYRHDMQKVVAEEKQCEGDDWILPKSLVRTTSVFGDTLEAAKFDGKLQLAVRNVTIVGGCNKPFQMKNVAIVELARKINKSIVPVKPICMSPDQTFGRYSFHGFGDNSHHIKDATLRHTRLVWVPCPGGQGSPDIFCVQSHQPLCNGDFGGAAVKKVDGRLDAFGIYIGGPYDCRVADEKTIYQFSNLTTLARKVCSITGVCNPQILNPTTKAPVTTTTPVVITTTTSDFEMVKLELPDYGTVVIKVTAEPSGPSVGNETTIVTEGPNGPSVDNETTIVTEGPNGPSVGNETTIVTEGPNGPSVGNETTIVTEGPNGPSVYNGTIFTEGPYGPSGDNGTIFTEGPNGPNVNNGTTFVTEGPYGQGGDNGTTVTEGPSSPNGTNGTIVIAGTDGNTLGNGACHEEEDGDIHIHIKLGKYRETGNPKDIVEIIKGPGYSTSG